MLTVPSSLIMIGLNSTFFPGQDLFLPNLCVEGQTTVASSFVKALGVK